MNITPESMEAMIFNNMVDIDEDPHLKKLLAELKVLKEEISSSKGSKSSIKTGSNGFTNSNHKQKRKRRHTEHGDTFRCSVYISPTRRKSDRLSGKSITYEMIDDIDELENKNLYANGRLRLTSYRNVNLKPFSHHHASERIILRPEEVTQEMLNNISYKLNDRIYDKLNGSSCHQCRQKTIDTKTVCRNFDCFGVRGQFCGTCALNRYGVDIAEALLDPNWACFVCQGICNCSFCRTRRGMRPTGILAPIAKREGHDSVKEFLDSLKLTLSEEDDLEEYMRDPETVLGFKTDSIILTVNGEEELFQCGLGNLKATLIRDFIEDFDNCFLGFTNECILSSEKKIKLFQSILQTFQ
ncbi:hypothetical protein WA026_018732 [Henosepilachna vigintioctopunctata]|uniref:Zinc-finger domain-containing protein n=1 Tax=Henosepilachna vigintioctopunctata TaxID=420089 RepID=A0AAW1TXN3_9CUCU